MNSQTSHRTTGHEPIVIMLRVSNARAVLYLHDHEIALTPYQHAILFTLSLRRGQFHSAAWLDRSVYGHAADRDPESRLRDDVDYLRVSLAQLAGQNMIEFDPALGYALSNRISIEIDSRR